MAAGQATVKAATAAQAAHAFKACAGLDPSGRATPAAMALAGQAFKVETEKGHAVYTLGALHGACWVWAAAGQGEGMTEAGLDAIEQQARAAGFERVGFQTLRRGLVRKAQRLGYGITGRIGAGYILQKTIA